MLGLQVIICIPIASAMLATLEPIAPSPINPSVAPRTSLGILNIGPGRQASGRVDPAVCRCKSSRLKLASSSAIVSSAVASFDGPNSVQLTRMPRLVTAVISIWPLRAPVNTMALRSGNCARSASSIGVLSRINTNTSASLIASIKAAPRIGALYIRTIALDSIAAHAPIGANA